MSIVEEPNTPARLALRVKAILLRPAATWEAIEGEPATIKGLMVGYVAPLAAIRPVCNAIGQLAFGNTGSLGLTYRQPVAQLVGTAVLRWLTTLAAIYVFALILEALAPYFGGKKDRIQAFKLAAYAFTAAAVAGVFHLYPPLMVVSSVLALYSLWLMYLGLPRLLKVTGDRALLYTVCAVICAMGLLMLVGILTSLLLTPFFLLTGGVAP